MNDISETRISRHSTLVAIAIVSVIGISSLSFGISRYVIDQEKPGKEATLRLANEAYDRGDFSNASYLYERYISTFDKNDVSVKIDYAYSLHNTGKSEAGLSILKEVLGIQPRNAFALFNIAVIYYRDGNKAKAKEWMNRCVINGDNTEIVNKARALLEQM